MIAITCNDAKSNLPPGCSCYNGTDGIFPRSCYIPGCSRGNNDGCNSLNVLIGNNYRIQFNSGTDVVHGCNCPDFSYNNGTSTGDNGVSTNTVDTPIILMLLFVATFVAHYRKRLQANSTATNTVF
ncbi:unnamed protein product [Rotaria socialis]